MNKPASAPDVIPPRPRPAPGEEEEPGEGTNATQHHPDPSADRRGPTAREDHKPRSPYVAGNT